MVFKKKKQHLYITCNLIKHLFLKIKHLDNNRNALAVNFCLKIYLYSTVPALQLHQQIIFY